MSRTRSAVQSIWGWLGARTPVPFFPAHPSVIGFCSHARPTCERYLLRVALMGVSAVLTLVHLSGKQPSWMALRRYEGRTVFKIRISWRDDCDPHAHGATPGHLNCTRQFCACATMLLHVRTAVWSTVTCTTGQGVWEREKRSIRK